MVSTPPSSVMNVPPKTSLGVKKETAGIFRLSITSPIDINSVKHEKPPSSLAWNPKFLTKPKNPDKSLMEDLEL